MGQRKVHKSSIGAKYNKPRPPQANTHTHKHTRHERQTLPPAPHLPFAAVVILLQNEAADSRG